MNTAGKRFFGAVIGAISAAALIIGLMEIPREIGYWLRQSVVTRELITYSIGIIGSIGGILFAKNSIWASAREMEPRRRLWFYLLGMAIGGIGIALLLLTKD